MSGSQTRLWNLAIKVANIDADLAFYLGCGATLVSRDPRPGDGRPFEVAVIEWLGTRILLTPRPLFEADLREPMPVGLTHAVWQVDDFDAMRRALREHGAHELPQGAAFKGRKVALFRTPGGLSLQIMEPKKQ